MSIAKNYILLLLLLRTVAAQPVTQPTNEAIPAPELLSLFKRALGDRYAPGQSQKYLQAPPAMENYFTATSGEQRKAILAGIEMMNVDPNILGRLARVRSTWPSLTGGGV